MKQIDNQIDFLIKDLQSQEGRKSAVSFFSKIKIKEKKENEHVERLHTKVLNGFDLSLFIQKVQTLYKSDKYKDRWFSRGIEPPEDLYFLLFKYAIKYGKHVDDKETLDKLSSYFSTSYYYLAGHYLTMMVGQGAYVAIIKE